MSKSQAPPQQALQAVKKERTMAEEANDVALEATVEQTTETESSPVEQAAEPVTEEASEETEQGEAEATETEAESDETLAPKSQNRFQKLANRNRELEARIAELEQLNVPSEQDYLDGGYDPIEAKVNAMQAEMHRQKELNKITSLNAAIDNDMARIIHEYPQLDPQSDSFNKDLAVKLFAQYDKDSGAKYADGGIVLEATQLPHEYIKEKMDLIGIAAKDAQVKAQKSVEKMVSAAETPTGKISTPKAAKEMTTKELEASLGMIYQ